MSAELVTTTTREGPITPLVLLHQAIAQGVGIEQLERLQAMHERWEEREAKKLFIAAMNLFKKNPPALLKTEKVEFDMRSGRRKSYNFAPLNKIVDAITSGLARVGISHRWQVEQDKEWIKVTCILTHEATHREETTLMGQADQSDGKNLIQAVGSTVTYLQRYTLLAATGMATGEQDDDGHGGKANGKHQEEEHHETHTKPSPAAESPETTLENALKFLDQEAVKGAVSLKAAWNLLPPATVAIIKGEMPRIKDRLAAIKANALSVKIRGEPVCAAAEEER